MGYTLRLPYTLSKHVKTLLGSFLLFCLLSCDSFSPFHKTKLEEQDVPEQVGKVAETGMLT